MIKISKLPDGVPVSDRFAVYARSLSDESWQKVPCRQICIGHQKGEWEYSGLTVLDFDGSAEFRIDYLKSNIDSVDIRPHSYAVRPDVDHVNKTISFVLDQTTEAPRKLMVRINDSWGNDVLHLLTNPAEGNDVPLPDQENVLRIRSGDPIPDVLPEGKDTYYFDKGIHFLPRGLWAIVDLRSPQRLESFIIRQGGFKLDDCGSGKPLYDPLSFIIEGKNDENSAWSVIYDGRDNKQTGVIKGPLLSDEYRLVRLRLLGTTQNNGWIFACVVGALELYGQDGSKDLARGNAIDGAIPQYPYLTDGRTDTVYEGDHRSASWHAGESFFLSRSGTKVYLAQGSEVLGAIASEGISDISVTGRGVLNSSVLHHEDPVPGEARTGAVWFTGGKNIRLDGITILDAPMWQVVLNYNENIIVRNINLLGYVVNADGIHLSGSSNALVEGCFVRSCDDLIVAYHYGMTRNITVRNSVFMNDDAHVFLFGLGETDNASIKEIKIENCDIISQQEAPWLPYRFSGVFKFWAHGGNVIEDVDISDIRIDKYRNTSKGCLFQLRTERRFENERPGRAIKHVSFRNIISESDDETPSLISGTGEDSLIEDIALENIVRGGVRVSKSTKLNLNIEGNVKRVEINGGKFIES